MTNELEKYLIEQCRQWMLPEEIRALRRIGLTLEGEKTEREIAKSNPNIEEFNGFNDPKTNELVNVGKEKMLRVISEQLLERSGKELINNCPQCGKLARTPFSRQCRHCGYYWN